MPQQINKQTEPKNSLIAQDDDSLMGQAGEYDHLSARCTTVSKLRAYEILSPDQATILTQSSLD